jgi:hypothetical protein
MLQRQLQRIIIIIVIIIYYHHHSFMVRIDDEDQRIFTPHW